MLRLAPLLALLAPLNALAQSTDAPSVDTLPEAEDAPMNVQYQKETHIDFEGTGVSASVVGPSQVFTIERRPASFNPLIQLRINFNDQMRIVDNEVR